MERPWRRAELLFLASKRVRVSEEKLRAVAARADEPATLPTSTVAPRSPDEHEPVQASRFRRLDVPKYLSHFGLGFTEVPGKDNKGRMRWALERCPFHPDHGGRDCVVFQGEGGRLGFKCFHSRCAGKSWKDLRSLIGRPLPQHFDGAAESLILANFREVSEVGPAAKAAYAGRSGREIVDELLQLTAGWPKRIGKSLFVCGPGGLPHYFEGKRDVDSLFAWIQSHGIRTLWRKGAGLISRSEFFEHLCIGCEEFASIETLPHEPPLPGVYYMTPEYPHQKGSCLEQLVARFNPATPGDRSLIKALFVTPFWGGLGGQRPAFVIEGPEEDEDQAGRGVGKTTLVEMVAELAGGYLDCEVNEDPASIKKRLLSPDARAYRIGLLDNLKSLHFSSGALEKLITASTISGHQLYHGEARRANTITWALTLNSAALSKDLAQRSVVIRLARPQHSGNWESQTKRFIAENRETIVGDILWTLGRRGEAK